TPPLSPGPSGASAAAVGATATLGGSSADVVGAGSGVGAAGASTSLPPGAPLRAADAARVPGRLVAFGHASAQGSERGHVAGRLSPESRSTSCPQTRG
ncbi:MAG TPA: hypothetical protein VJY65_10715, partial [Chloroflexota bacterium]|nr:hypothetical protein [Chloroflexota bacterium]